MSFHVTVGTSTTVSLSEEGLDTPREKRKWSMLTAIASRTSASIVSSCNNRKGERKGPKISVEKGVREGSEGIDQPGALGYSKTTNWKNTIEASTQVWKSKDVRREMFLSATGE